jgi:hypothetical protein
MVHADGRLYALMRSGETLVFAAKPTYELLVVDKLKGESTYSSPAMSNGQIFLRTFKNLWCVEEKNNDAAVGLPSKLVNLSLPPELTGAIIIKSLLCFEATYAARSRLNRNFLNQRRKQELLVLSQNRADYLKLPLG